MRCACVRAGVEPYVRELIPSLKADKIIIDSNLSEYDFSEYDEVVMIYSLYPRTPSMKKVGFFNTEQMTRYSVMESGLAQVRHYKPDKVYDYSKTNKEIWYRNGVDAEVLPYITDDIDELKRLIEETPKEFDFAFSGTLSQRRLDIINLFREAGFTVLVTSGFGQERDKELARARCLLNIHYANDYIVYESARCQRWSDAGMTVYTEDGYDVPKGVYRIEIPLNKSYIRKFILSNK